jgi:hypothetical protein
MSENRMTRMKRRVSGRAGATTALGLALSVGPGCEGQADPSYSGEPLVSVSGQVEAALSGGDLEVGVLWLTAESDFDLVCTGESTPSREESSCVNPF